jgi:hypothetical protein
MSVDDSDSSGIDLASKLAEKARDESVEGRIRVELTDEEVDRVYELAEARNQSYRDGRTTDTNFSDKDGEELHVQGLMAEAAMSILYGEAKVDTSISARGDDGSDCSLRIGCEINDVDIKSRDRRCPDLMVKTDKVRYITADILVNAFVDVDNSEVEFIGYCSTDELFQDCNIQESPVPWLTHDNYTREYKEGFESMPVPDVPRDNERVEYRT